MAINKDNVKKVAQLARIAIPETQMTQYSEALSKILAFIEQMNAVDTTNILPQAHPLDVSQPWRMDKITETNQRDLLQALAPQVAEGFYLVPQVIE